jgi:hypothetical protein
MVRVSINASRGQVDVTLERRSTYGSEAIILSRVPIHIHGMDLGPDEFRAPTSWGQARLTKALVPPEFSPFPHTETELTEPKYSVLHTY